MPAMLLPASTKCPIASEKHRGHGTTLAAVALYIYVCTLKCAPHPTVTRVTHRVTC